MANGNVPLDGVAFAIDLLEWGRMDFWGVSSASYLRLGKVPVEIVCTADEK